MKPKSSSHNLWLIGFTIFFGIVLTIIPMPTWGQYGRPAWVLLILVYWAIFLPKRVSVGTAWISGLLVDGLQGALIGEYAFIYTLAIFITHQLHTRIRLFPILQQCVYIFLLVGISYIITVWIQGMSGQPVRDWYFALGVLISTIIWPLLSAFLEWVRVHFSVR